MFSIRDKVTVLDEAINGIVVKVNGDEITIATEEGFELVFNDKELISSGQHDLLKNISNHSITQISDEKEIAKPRKFLKQKKSKKDTFVLEIDLHIEKLVSSKKGMSNYDILNLQITTAQRQLEFAIKNKIPKIVFIHGMGEGILKAELYSILGRYDAVAFQDADYRKYGAPKLQASRGKRAQPDKE